MLTNFFIEKGETLELDFVPWTIKEQKGNLEQIFHHVNQNFVAKRESIEIRVEIRTKFILQFIDFWWVIFSYKEWIVWPR